MSRRARLGVAAGAVGAVAVAVWLACAAAAPEMVPAAGGRMTPKELGAARVTLQERGISCQVRGSRLLVPRGQLEQARLALAERSAGEGPAASFESLARQNDIWSTADQQAKRWQAAKMSTLGRLIETFASVRSATVLFESGSPRGLGNPGVEPTASVNIVLEEGASTTPELVTAIADQVAASIAGMKRENVRVVDNTGRSYRAAADAAPEGLAEVRAAELHYRDCIRCALEYLGRLALAVHVTKDSSGIRCQGASVSVPRSYLAALYASQHSGRGRPSDAELSDFARPHLDKIRQVVMKATGVTDPSAVTVDWHFDADGGLRDEGGGEGQAAAGAWAAWASHHARGLAVGVATAAWWVLLLAVALRRRARRRNKSAGGRPASPPRSGQDKDECDRYDPVLGSESPFAFLQDVPREDVVSLLEEEHPQTIALVLAHLGAARAAGILAALPSPRQVEVVRRMVHLGSVDASSLQAVRASLAERAAKLPARELSRMGGVGRIAEILHHAGYATEQKVLESLSSQQPELAESIRRRMFVFEDIARMPARQLREALESLESDELAVALRTAGEDLRKKMLSSLSAAFARQVREEMEQIGPVRLSDVEAAQQRVMEAIRRCERGRYVSVSQEKSSEVVV